MTATRRELMFNLSLGALLVPSILRSHSAASKPIAKAPPVVPAKPVHQAPRVPVASSITQTPTHHKKIAPRSHKHHKTASHPPKRHDAKGLRAQATLDTPGNRRELALTIWAEARGYQEIGMISVGNVIMNRVKAGTEFFGDGVQGVCHKRKQFSCWNKWDKNFKQIQDLPHLPSDSEDWKAFVVADRIAGQLLAGIIKDNTGGATFYCASYMTPYWAKDMTIVGVMYGHTFYKPKAKKKHTHNSHHKGHHGSYHHSHSSHHHKPH